MAKKRKSMPEDIRTSLCVCNRLNEREAAEQLLRELPEHGIQLLDGTRQKPDKTPERWIKSTGSILVPIYIRHATLDRGFFEVTRELTFGIANLSFIAESHSVIIHQNLSEEANNLDKLVNGQLSLARHLYPVLQPVYGWIDEMGENALERKFTSIRQLRYVFWANVFGPAFVEQIGEKFLSKCPAHAVERLSDGGAIVLSTASYSQWYADPPQKLADYLAQKVPGIKLYRSIGVNID